MQNTGQIIRSKKTGKDKYTPISNEILQSTTLTPEEKTVLIYLLSLPSDWVVLKRQLIEWANFGRDKFNKAWKGLHDSGYILSIRVFNQKTGQFVGWNHIVYEEPVLEDNRDTENPKVGESESREIRQSENQYIYKVITEQSNNSTKEYINNTFEEFWNLYDKKVSKESAVKAFKKIPQKDYDNIRNNIPIFVKQFSDKQFQPHFATYLNGKRWQDEISTKTQTFKLTNIATLNDD
jgi:DNA replication protein DnaC